MFFYWSRTNILINFIIFAVRWEQVHQFPSILFQVETTNASFTFIFPSSPSICIPANKCHKQACNGWTKLEQQHISGSLYTYWLVSEQASGNDTQRCKYFSAVIFNLRVDGKYISFLTSRLVIWRFSEEMQDKYLRVLPFINFISDCDSIFK